MGLVYMAEAREGMYACMRVCVRCDEVQQAKLVPSCTGIVHVVPLPAGLQ